MSDSHTDADLFRCVALALVSGDYEGRLGDSIPAGIWDDLYSEGLIVNLESFPGGDSSPHMTPAGEDALLGTLRGL